MSKRFKVALAIVFTVSAGYSLYKNSAHAGEIWGEYHVGSNHSDKYWYDDNGRRHEFNENNTGGGISYGINDNVEVIGGFYRNSYDNTSVYAGADVHTGRRHGISVGVSAGKITGYEDTPTATKFMVLPNVVIGNRRSVFRTKVSIMPIGKVKFISLTIGLAL